MKMRDQLWDEVVCARRDIRIMNFCYLYSEFGLICDGTISAS